MLAQWNGNLLISRYVARCCGDAVPLEERCAASITYPAIHASALGCREKVFDGCIEEMTFQTRDRLGGPWTSIFLS
jgi:hypothetical protein